MHWNYSTIFFFFFLLNSFAVPFLCMLVKYSKNGTVWELPMIGVYIWDVYLDGEDFEDDMGSSVQSNIL